MVAEGRATRLRHMITQNYRFGAQPRTEAKHSRPLLQTGHAGQPFAEQPLVIGLVTRQIQARQLRLLAFQIILIATVKPPFQSPVR